MKEKKLDITLFDFEQLFYLIGINYSHFSLNAVHTGQWLTKLFEKNDGYQTPIVINPYRENGNINVNSEHDLVKSRLLANLLEPIPESDEMEALNIRKLTDQYYADRIQFSMNFSKTKFVTTYNNKIVNLTTPGLWDNVISTIYNEFSIGEIESIAIPQSRIPILPYIHNYLKRKLFTIASRYVGYDTFLNDEGTGLKDLPGFLTKLKSSKSHLTFKFMQAINFLKNYETFLGILKFEEGGWFVEIPDLEIVIQKIKLKEGNSELTTMELLPPSIFSTDIILNHAFSFHGLSSGEKQRIYSVSSLVYHLINLDSIRDPDLIRYPFVNVIFDEVELYFHPEMQRDFINYLLGYLRRISLDIECLNFQFITHSPFILSDIPVNNILFLIPKPKTEQPFPNTLGANVHDMLAHSFFLRDGFMGEFIKKQIKSLTRYLVNDPAAAVWDQQKALQLINAIGEPLIKDRLNMLYKIKFDDIDAEIEQLQLTLNRLKDEKNKRN